MTIEIMTCPVISTGHLTAETRTELDENNGGCSFMSGPYGWMFYVQQDGDFDNMPGDLAVVMVWARANGWQWVRFDVDADVVPELPYFED